MPGCGMALHRILPADRACHAGRHGRNLVMIALSKRRLVNCSAALTDLGRKARRSNLCAANSESFSTQAAVETIDYINATFAERWC